MIRIEHLKKEFPNTKPLKDVVPPEQARARFYGASTGWKNLPTVISG